MPILTKKKTSYQFLSVFKGVKSNYQVLIVTYFQEKTYQKIIKFRYVNIWYPHYGQNKLAVLSTTY